MKNQATMIPPKKTNKSLITDPEEMEIYDFPDKKKLKIITWKKLNEMQKNTGN